MGNPLPWTAVEYGVAADLLGETTSDKMEISVDGETVVSAPVSELKTAWENALEHALHADAGLK